MCWPQSKNMSSRTSAVMRSIKFFQMGGKLRRRLANWKKAICRSDVGLCHDDLACSYVSVRPWSEGGRREDV